MVRLLILLTLALTACTNFEKTFEGWVGYHTDELVSEWGPPASMYEMADGRKMLSYTAQQAQHVEGPGIPVPFTANYWCEVVYTAGIDGVITAANYNGNIGGCNTLLKRKGKPPQLKQ